MQFVFFRVEVNCTVKVFAWNLAKAAITEFIFPLWGRRGCWCPVGCNLYLAAAQEWQRVKDWTTWNLIWPYRPITHCVHWAWYTDSNEPNESNEQSIEFTFADQFTKMPSNAVSIHVKMPVTIVFPWAIDSFLSHFHYSFFDWFYYLSGSPCELAASKTSLASNLVHLIHTNYATPIYGLLSFIYSVASHRSTTVYGPS